jgi:transcriptional regulator with XRE-family HTH domain
MGHRVRKRREHKGWSQERLAEVSDLHRTYISGIERGVRNPTLTVLHQLARALGVGVGELVD